MHGRTLVAQLDRCNFSDSLV